MRRTARALASLGLVAAVTAAHAQDGDIEIFADVTGAGIGAGMDSVQLAAVPGYGALPLIARTDPTETLPGLGGPERSAERPLGLSDEQLYRQIFAAQEAGDLAIADGLIRQLGDTLLIGHVLHQRYMHPTAYRSSYGELAEWLRLYHDHPGAEEIYDLAVRRQGAGDPPPTPPSVTDALSAYGNGAAGRASAPVDVVRDSDGERAARSLLSSIRRSLRDEDRAGALATLAGGNGLLSSAEAGEARGLIAFNAFLNSADAEALEQAALAVAQAGNAAPSALWAGGLAAWRTGDYALARERFAALAASPYASRWTRTAGAYWAARAAIRAHAPNGVSALLRQAAQEPDTFYGMLAQHALGLHDPRSWTEAQGSDDVLGTVLAQPAARRGLALLQIGQPGLAEAEFRSLATGLNGQQMRALLAFAADSDMPSLAMRLAVAYAERGGEQVWAARYPVPRWLPANGLQLDHAVVLAIMRQESAFNSVAVSSAGARGLMQLMPRTARSMAQRLGIGSGDTAELADPAYNMALGQQFIQELRSYSWIGDDMFRILAAYNGGPGNLQRWLESGNFGNDPLLFIETIRAGETREYVERVMANLWAYRLRFGQPTPELDDIVGGDWPHYRNLNAQVSIASLPH
ncbi:MAG: lytic transglycosylase domain-containing protein [Alphaproteobacteria bacterium]